MALRRSIWIVSAAVGLGCLVLLALQYSPVGRPDFTCAIEPTAPTYVLNEPVVISCALRNDTRVSAWLLDRGPWLPWVAQGMIFDHEFTSETQRGRSSFVEHLQGRPAAEGRCACCACNIRVLARRTSAG